MGTKARGQAHCDSRCVRSTPLQHCCCSVPQAARATRQPRQATPDALQHPTRYSYCRTGRRVWQRWPHCYMATCSAQGTRAHARRRRSCMQQWHTLTSYALRASVARDWIPRTKSSAFACEILRGMEVYCFCSSTMWPLGTEFGARRSTRRGLRSSTHSIWKLPLPWCELTRQHSATVIIVGPLQCSLVSPQRVHASWHLAAAAVRTRVQGRATR
jgi:hypothetical protein